MDVFRFCNKLSNLGYIMVLVVWLLSGLIAYSTLSVAMQSPSGVTKFLAAIFCVLGERCPESARFSRLRSTS